MQRIVLLACVAAALAAPAPQSDTQRGRPSAPPITIISYENSPTGDGGNQHSYTTSNGIERQEGVFIKEITVTDENGQQRQVKIPVYKGSYKYEQPDGTLVDVQYIADETGFHPVGDSIPKAL